MKKRLVVGTMGTILAVSVLSGCGNTASSEETGKSSESGKESISISFRDNGDGEKSAQWRWIQKAYDSWELKDQVDLKIEPITASEGDYFAKIALNLSSEETCPDVVLEDTFQLPNDVAAGYLTDLTDYLKDYEDWNDGSYFDSMKKLVTVDGSSYAIPYSTDTRGLWYNRDILTQAGVIEEGTDWEPKDWQEILDACEAVKENCDGVVPFWCNSGVATGEATSMTTYEMLLYATGEELLDSDGKWVVNSDGILDALTFLKDIYDDGYGPELGVVLDGQASDTAARDYMPEGKLAIFMDGMYKQASWVEEGIAPWAEYSSVLGFAKLPTNEGQEPGTMTMSGGWSAAIPAKADQKDFAWEFIKALCSEENVKWYALAEGNLTTRTDVAEDEEYTAVPFNTEATQMLESAKFRPQNDQYSSVTTCIYTMVENVVTGMDPQDAMEQYATDVIGYVGEDNVSYEYK